MDSDRRRRVDDLLRSVLEQPVGERDRFLREACGNDSELESQVRRLLEAGDEHDSFLQPAGAQLGPVWGALIAELATADAQEPDEPPHTISDQIGPYRVLRQIGRGGMGSVYLAQRAGDKNGPPVALKILAPGLDDDSVRRRFEQERHILATLDHPAIARHLDGGVTGDGRPYLAMEHVQGEPIDSFCDDLRLTLEQRLRLFLEVARAVQYAHRCMVVHRDLKPSNILVTEDNQVKLLDFGIAKLLDEGDGPLPGLDAEPLTRTGLRVMTPEYAAPEQVRGGMITTATDVYQLGLVLYELLSGRRPYRVDGRTPAEIERVICEQEPSAPSTAVKRSDGGSPQTGGLSATAVSGNRGLRPERLQARLRGDLDVIVLMALRKEPQRRYLSVDHLIQDIERHLEGRPISARKDTFGYRIAKFVRRHRIGLAAGTSILLLTASLIGFLIDRQLDRHEQTRLEAERAAQVAAFLEGLFDVAEPGSGSGETISARQLLDRGVERINTDLELQPKLQVTLQQLLGDMYRKLGLYEQARPLLDRALETRRSLHGDLDGEVAASLNACARLDLETGRFDDAEAALREAISIQESLQGTQNLDLARSQASLAEVLDATGRLEEAEPLFRNALQILQARLGPNHQEVAKTLIGLSSLYWSQGRFDSAEPLLRQALAIYDQAHERDDRLYAIALSDLGQLHARRGEYTQAEQLLRRGHSVLEKMLGPEHPNTAMSLKAIARLLAEQGELDRAEPLFQQALAILEQAHQGGHPDIGECLHDIALLYWDRGEYSKAEQTLLQALAMGETTLGADHPDVGAGLNSLGALYWRLGRLADAEAAYRRSLNIAEKGLGEHHPHLAVVLVNLARVVAARGDHEVAIALCERAVRINEHSLGSEHIDVAHSRAVLARLVADCGRFEQAQSLFRLVLETQEQVLGAEHPGVIATLLGRCRVRADQGQYNEAITMCQRAVAVAAAALGDDDPELADAKAGLASVLLSKGSAPDRAESLLRQAINTMTAAFGPKDPELVPLECLLAQALVQQGRTEEARQALRLAEGHATTAPPVRTPVQRFDLAETYLVLGGLERSEGRIDEATRLARSALALTRPWHEETCKLRWLRIRATALLRLDRVDEARPLVERLLATGYRHRDLELPPSKS